ncbi:hypothetical protein, partial [Sphingomonas koreensis]
MRRANNPQIESALETRALHWTQWRVRDPPKREWQLSHGCRDERTCSYRPNCRHSTFGVCLMICLMICAFGVPAKESALARIETFSPASIDSLRQGRLEDPRTPDLMIEVLPSGRKVWKYERRLA